MTPQEYCQQKARESGSSFYASFLFLPKPKKEAMMALYAFCREADDVVDAEHNPEVAKIKLEFWFKEIDRMYAGKPQHPVTRALSNHLPNFHWEKKHFIELLQGMEMDLKYQGYQKFDDLKLYCYHAASVVGILSCYIFGFTEKATLKFAKDLGVALQLINIIRDFGEDLRNGRIYIPEEELAQFNITPQQVLDRTLNQANLAQCLAFQAKRARELYQSALSVLPEVDRYNQRSALIMAEIYFKLLSLIEEENFDVLNQKISLPPFRKIWTASIIARREKKRAKRTIAAL